MQRTFSKNYSQFGVLKISFWLVWEDWHMYWYLLNRHSTEVCWQSYEELKRKLSVLTMVIYYVSEIKYNHDIYCFFQNDTYFNILTWSLTLNCRGCSFFDDLYTSMTVTHGMNFSYSIQLFTVLNRMNTFISKRSF